MPDTAIQIDDLGKMYRLGLTHAGSIRALVDRWTRRILRRPWDEDRVDEKEFWALRNLDAQIKDGEVVGIIGKNGAGKSTLLKILSRVTKPTTGRATIRGRVGSLLEVGTGFHPELTGRENIFLNGTILGMKRREISRKIDEIIDFAEIDRFIETPVKRYSSGMYVRLAFAVAAHLEPEVLIVDEVLAVGDSAFQKKCLGKMESVGRTGRTILFVSHNMAAIRQLCQRAILLKQGELVSDGPAMDVVDQYLQLAPDLRDDGTLGDDVERIGTAEARIDRVHLLGNDDERVAELFLGQPCRVRFDFNVLQDITDAHFEVAIHSHDGSQVCVTHRDLDQPPVSLVQGSYTVQGKLDVYLLPGRYRVGVAIYRDNGHAVDLIERTTSFEVLRMPKHAGRHYRWSKVRGFVRPTTTWKLEHNLPTTM